MEQGEKIEISCANRSTRKVDDVAQPHTHTQRGRDTLVICLYYIRIYSFSVLFIAQKHFVGKQVLNEQGEKKVYPSRKKSDRSGMITGNTSCFILREFLALDFICSSKSLLATDKAGEYRLSNSFSFVTSSSRLLLFQRLFVCRLSAIQSI